MPQPGSHKFDVKRARIRDVLDDAGIPDKRADELARALARDPKKAGRRLPPRVVRNLRKFIRPGR